MKSQYKCPQCNKPVEWHDNPDRPFCSDRCRLVDLGQWVDESYRIPGQSQDVMPDKNIVGLYRENKQLKGNN